MKIFNIAEMVEAERQADVAGHSYATMMEMAGAGIAHRMSQRWQLQEKTILILVGPGNNGGDGLVAGRYLADMGANIIFYLFKMRDDDNFKRVIEMGISIYHAQDDDTGRFLRKVVESADFIIDALLGTGVKPPLREKMVSLLAWVRESLAQREQADTSTNGPINRVRPPSVSNINRPKIVAVDCPSGLHCDTGTIDPIALPADLSITFAGPKQGHFLFPGASYCGEIEVVDIGIAAEITQEMPFELITPDYVRTRLPQRRLDGHKGKFGRMLVIAGSEKYQGAPLFVAKAGFRAGAGLVTLITPEPVRRGLVTELPEAIYPKFETGDRFEVPNADSIKAYALEQRSPFDALVIGPGLDKTGPFLNRFFSKGHFPPTVIDADGLNFLPHIDWINRIPPNSILTPHPGEMSRLTAIPLPTLIKKNRFEVAVRYAQEWRVVLVLKGAYTVVGCPDGTAYLSPFANPLLAVGGSGDVLAGIIGGLLAQGLEAKEAAITATYIHGAAGELGKPTFGDQGMLARELIDLVPQTIRGIKQA